MKKGNAINPIGVFTESLGYDAHGNYLLGGSMVLQEEEIDKVLFEVRRPRQLPARREHGVAGGGDRQGALRRGFFTATRLSPTTYGFTAYHYNKDHLGNNREVVGPGGSVQQVTNYYPFGAPYADPSAVTGAYLQPYKYNFSIEREKRKPACSSEREKNRPKVSGKELDTMHGLDTYDYGARQYDPILGRWDRMDPLCEKYYSISPYAYCGDNPVRYIDPDGKIIVLANNCSPEFVKQYNAAYAYLKEHNAAQVWDKLNERKEIITIYEHNENANYTLKDDIYWNPFSGLYTSAKGEGHRISPTIRLIHEMGHKLQELTGEYDTASDGSEWYSKEEKRDILEVETPAAIACGEIPENVISRDSHSGIPFITDSSTSTMIVNPDDPDVKRMIECWE